MKLSKTILPVFLSFLLFFGNGYSQCDNSAIDYIYANKVKAPVTSGGDFFWRGINNFEGMIVPFSPGEANPIQTLIANAIWIGGFDDDGNLRVAGPTYGYFSDQFEFWPGPIDAVTLDVVEGGCENFDRIWKTNRGDILQVIKDFADNGIINDPIPISVFSWPARGNLFFESFAGFPLPDQELAPFFDRNNNGFYEPFSGDYPILDPSLPNSIPDEMTWAVFNDIYGIHNTTNGLPLGAEVHFMAYAFNCADNDLLNQTLFTRHKIINRSGIGLSNFRIGVWSDADFYCYSNDFFGCDTSLQSLYFYRGKNDDLDPNCFSDDLYGDHPPVFTITFLNQELSTLTYHNNGAFGNPPFGTRDPDDAADFYHYLSGKWLDGSPLIYGSDGYAPGGTDYVNHVFYDNPNDPNGWSMESEDLDFYDRRTVMGSGGFDLPAGGQIILDAAYSYHRNTELSSLETVNFALENVESLRSFYENDFEGGCVQATFCELDCVWPGDANRDGIAKNNDLLFLGLAMADGSIGVPRIPPSFVWAAQNADNWGAEIINGLDLKNADFSGDGKLDSTDVAILDLNYRSEKLGYTEMEIQAPKEEGGLYIDFDKDEVSANGNIVQRRARGTIKVATVDNPIEELYGIALTIKYDTSVWESGLGGLVSLGSANPVFSDLENTITIAKGRAEEGRIEIAISKTNGQPENDAWGDIGSISLSIREGAATGNPNGTQTLSVQIYNAIGVDGKGSFFFLDGLSDVVIGKDMAFDPTLTDVDEIPNGGIPLTIFPNPNNGTFDLFFDKTAAASQISVFDFSGKIIWTEKVPAYSELHTVDLSGDLPSGIYFVKWVLADGRFAVRKVVVK